MVDRCWKQFELASGQCVDWSQRHDALGLRDNNNSPLTENNNNNNNNNSFE